jgi:hypothetical protein
MGAAMMALDDAWRHGFYELKHRFNTVMEVYDYLKKDRTKIFYDHFPGKYVESRAPKPFVCIMEVIMNSQKVDFAVFLSILGAAERFS